MRGSRSAQAAEGEPVSKEGAEMEEEEEDGRKRRKMQRRRVRRRRRRKGERGP